MLKRESCRNDNIEVLDNLYELPDNATANIPKVHKA